MKTQKLTKEEGRKEHLKKIIMSSLAVSESLLLYHRTLTDDEKILLTIAKSLKNTRRAMKIIPTVKHIEILESLYNTLLGGKENYFVLFGTIITAKNNIIRWDSTERGFQEFLRLEEQAKVQYQKDCEERKKQQEILQKAKESGKKVEFAFEEGKLKPLIVEDKVN